MRLRLPAQASFYLIAPMGSCLLARPTASVLTRILNDDSVRVGFVVSDLAVLSGIRSTNEQSLGDDRGKQDKDDGRGRIGSVGIGRRRGMDLTSGSGR